MGKLYEEKWYPNWAKISNMGRFPWVCRYRYRAVPVQPTKGPTCIGTGYRYRCAQNAQNVVFLYN